MKLEYTNKHKRMSRGKVMLIVMAILATLASMTFIGAFFDYYFQINILTYVTFVAAIVIAYVTYKKTIVEYKYIYGDNVFTVDRLLDGNGKTIFACDKSYIEDILSYEECKDKYDGVKYTLLSFCRREACTAVVYKNQGNMKAILIYADEEFVSGLKAAIAEN